MTKRNAVDDLKKLVDGADAWPNCMACGVRDTSICASLSDDALNDICGRPGIQRSAVSPGTILFEQDQAASHVFMIKVGVLKLFRCLPDGRRQVIGFLADGDVLGLPSDEAECFCTAQALTRVDCCIIPRAEFDGLLGRYPELQQLMLVMASREIERQREHMILLGRKYADEKLASFLVLYAVRKGRQKGTSQIVELPMSRSDIADFLGLTVESVSRTFSRFRAQGLVRLIDANTVILVRPSELEELAGIDRYPIGSLAGGI